ncbi:hypothetical protein RRSWK_06099 [Rhodopirellula sp. SWK7]|nr:hypothetical protein RRSWK_06099 [Rhodopirellula sp. SWK7]
MNEHLRRHSAATMCRTIARSLHIALLTMEPISSIVYGRSQSFYCQ